MRDKHNDNKAQLVKNHSEQMWKQGASFDEILSYIKKSGFSQSISVFILKYATGVSLAEAKEAVIHCEAWSEVKEVNINFHNTINDFLDEQENDY